MRKVLLLILVVLSSLALVACGGSLKPVHTGQHVYHTLGGVAAHSSTFGLPPKGGVKLVPRSSAATVEMFDSVSIPPIPKNPFALAGYTAGYWPTYFSFRKAFPRAHVVSVAISWGYRAQCLDVEPGDAVPSQVGPWVKADIKAGFAKPCLYANISTMPQVRANLAAWGIPRSAVFLWDANWTYYRHLDAGYDATQWNNKAYSRNLDESSVTLAFLGINPKPVPARLICFGHRGTPHVRKCRSVVALYNRRHAAQVATDKALVPLRKSVSALSAREHWYRAHAAALVKAYS